MALKQPQMSWSSGKKKHDPSKKTTDTIKFVAVNGTEIRDHIDIDFTEGGHGYWYEYIPKDEIWVDDSEAKKDDKCIRLHEFIERVVMKELDIGYDEAHNDFASPIEQLFRDICVKKGILE